MANGKHEEFDEDCSAQLQNFSNAITRTTVGYEYSYNDIDIGSISDYLGIIWEPSKTVLFGFSVPYRGFVWNLSSHTVAVPVKKAQVYGSG